MADVDWFVSDTLDAAALIGALEAEGAVSHPLLAEPARRRLLAAAEAVAYRPGRSTVGSGAAIVRQELEWSDDFGAAGPFHDLTARYQALWDRALAALPRYPFATPLTFNEMILTRYRPGWLGITPHRDHASYINLVALIVLAGEGRFCVTADRSGREARSVDGAPGRVILMRAPGFLGNDVRPFHSVADIAATRIVFGLRHEHPPGARLERAARFVHRA